ncbi:MAG TPA: barstar family protein [Micromonosporaceae bacterium]|nr:barstar family protein [Micromonosporaceae bacterium]
MRLWGWTVIGRLASVTGGVRPPGVYRWRSRAHTESVRRELVAAGWGVYPLDGRGITGAGQLFDKCSAALAFPAWFGHNWDALADCLGDLGWLPAAGHVLLWEQYGVLARSDPKAWRLAYEVLTAAIEVRRDTNAAPLYVLLRGAGPQEQPDGPDPIPTL